MGDPKKPRKQYSGPRNPWDKRQADVDLNLIGVYGLRNKTELWKLQTKLSEIRKRVRDIISTKIISEKTKQKTGYTDAKGCSLLDYRDISDEFNEKQRKKQKKRG